MPVYRQIFNLIDTVDSRWFYVGHSDEAVEGEFRLLDGRLFNSADASQMGKWQRGQPNNWANRENIVQLSRNTKSLLDTTADNIDYGICEIRVYGY